MRRNYTYYNLRFRRSYVRFEGHPKNSTKMMAVVDLIMITTHKRKSLHAALLLTTLTATLLPASTSFLVGHNDRRPKLCFSTHAGSKLNQYPPDMSRYEDVFRATQRKHYEMKQFKKQHPPNDTSDPLNIAMGYNEETLGKMRMAKALRR